MRKEDMDCEADYEAGVVAEPIQNDGKTKTEGKTNKKKIFIIVGLVIVIAIAGVVGAVIATSGGGSSSNSDTSAATTTTTSEADDADDNDGSTTSTASTEAAPTESSKPPPGTTTMPNIGFLFAGYDLLKGNPIATGAGVASNDPGFRGDIFSSTFTELQTTPDLRYTLPDNISVRSCSGCNLEFSSTIMQSTTEYADKLSARASATGSYGGFGAKASFSASASYQRVRQEIFGTDKTVIHSEASCCAYDAEIQAFNLPKFHPNFLASLDTLPDVYEPGPYSKFFSTFGTHYVSKVSMGALFGEQSFITKENRETFESQGATLEVAASASGWGASGSVSASVSYDAQLAEAFRSVTTGRQIYSRGSLPPADGDQLTWSQGAIENPAPIIIELKRIDSLPLPVSEAVLVNLRQGTNEYCQELATEGLIASCDPTDLKMTNFLKPIENVAFNMPATQSSSQPTGEAGNAVDGSRRGTWNPSDNSVTLTQPQDTNPSWTVNFGREVDILRVDVYNRAEPSVQQRLSEALVTLRVGSQAVASKRLPDMSGQRLGSLSFANEPSVANALSISEPREGVLSLAEVEVLGIVGNPGVRRDPIVCPDSHYITDIQAYAQASLGITNIEITCSDGSILQATDNQVGEKQTLLSCPQGFDSGAVFGQVNRGGMQQLGEYVAQVIETSCDDSPLAQPSAAYTNDGGRAALSERIFCLSDEAVIGIQVEEVNNPDGGIIRFRFACNKKVNVGLARGV